MPAVMMAFVQEIFVLATFFHIRNRGRAFSRPVRHFVAPWRLLWILQAVQYYRQWASAPGANRLVFCYEKGVSATKNGVKFRQQSIGAIRFNLFMSYAMSPFFEKWVWEIIADRPDRLIDTESTTVRPCSSSSACKMRQRERFKLLLTQFWPKR